MDVGERPRVLGLGQYVATFRAHEIDDEVLADLTEADLKIGLQLGARKRLLKAIANLAPNEASPAPRAGCLSNHPLDLRCRAGTSPSAARSPSCSAISSARPISRLGLDAVDWRSLVNAYLDQASAAVTGLGGHVLKKLGDGF